MVRTEHLKLMLAGDVMTGRGIDQILAHPSAPGLREGLVHDARDYVRLAEALHGRIGVPVSADYVWGEALAAIERAAPDLRIVNLETAVTTSDDAWPAKGVHYRMNPANADCLTAARIDACTLANNHVLDWGRQGLQQTLQVLHAAGLHTAGAGMDGVEAWAPAVLPAPGHAQVLLFAFATQSSGVPSGWAAGPRRPGIALLPDLSNTSAQVVADDVARRRNEGDLAVVSIHWGGNWGLDVPRAHREFAHRLIELGAADVVHGHSSHHPLPVEVYRGKLILYGCGDLINDYEGIGMHVGLRSDVACLYFATLDRAHGRLQRLEIVPMQLKRFRLCSADSAARSWLERIFSVDGHGLRTVPGSGPPGAWSLQWQVEALAGGPG